MKIEWSNRSRNDLQDLQAYISKDSPYYAKQFLERIFMAVEKLETHPKIGRIVPEANREDVRELLFHNYRIMYQI
ncbi:MAG: type II toxin-antitoxin system RelE/ParE family toxin [Nitrospira sp.]|nr:type II toxin-antitoxin system RelE/ParE family toxin [Nitrospira sp.]